MKTITIPPNQTAVMSVDGKVVAVDLSLTDLLIKTVWTAPYWRTGSPDRIQAAVRMLEAFGSKKPGDTVELRDGDHEMLVECAMMKDQHLNEALAGPALTLLAALL